MVLDERSIAQIHPKLWRECHDVYVDEILRKFMTIVFAARLEALSRGPGEQRLSTDILRDEAIVRAAAEYSPVWWIQCTHHLVECGDLDRLRQGGEINVSKAERRTLALRGQGKTICADLFAGSGGVSGRIYCSERDHSMWGARPAKSAVCIDYNRSGPSSIPASKVVRRSKRACTFITRSNLNCIRHFSC